MEALGDSGYFVGFTGKGWAPGTLPPERKNITGKAYQRRRLEKPTSGISDVDYFANFRDFLADCPKGAPFCFWYGGHEPHRPYEYGSGVAKGHYKLEDVGPLPSYWPDTEAVRNDLLDYAFEIAHFDRQLGKMVDLLAEQGLLENTLVVATSDNGPPFPRMKGHPFEEACHLPLAMMWPKGIAAPGRKTEALVSFIDFAPTFLEVAGVDGAKAGMQPITGTSLTDLFANRKPALDRSTLLMGRERNDTRCRPGTESGLGYPVRALREGDFLYLHNFDPSRWPCGNPELGLKDTDNGPTKTAVEALGGIQPLLAALFRQAPRRLSSTTSRPMRTASTTWPLTPRIRARLRRCGRSCSPASDSRAIPAWRARATCSTTTRRRHPAPSRLPYRSRKSRLGRTWLA